MRRVQCIGQFALIIFFSLFLLMALCEIMDFAIDFRLISEMGHHLLVISMVMALAVWASMHRVIESYGWEIEAQRGALVLSELRRAKRDIGMAGSDELKKQAIFQCGSFFAKDQAAWHALHRAKPIEAISGS